MSGLQARVTTWLENLEDLEMSGHLTAAKKMSGNLSNVRGKYCCRTVHCLLKLGAISVFSRLLQVTYLFTGFFFLLSHLEHFAVTFIVNTLH